MLAFSAATERFSLCAAGSRRLVTDRRSGLLRAPQITGRLLRGTSRSLLSTRRCQVSRERAFCLGPFWDFAKTSYRLP